ncbi:ABC-2 transporter permease [Curtobacterium sp. 9128]|uniref:ABC-2 transporter permease n=1 Tax=Curtobacterium sp. 9128 TaxID=1793722 RepID=UPI0011A9AAD6|nr:ABC-2 transporter permease [Curtobacterium sp. 9128]
MITAFTRFDITSFATTQARRALVPLAFVVVFGAVIPVPGLAIVVGAVIAAVSVSYPFQGDERGQLDTLYANTLVRRRDVVVGRFLTVLAFAAAAVALGVLVSLVTAAVRHETMAWSTVGTLLLVAFGVTVACVAVQLPWFFALGYTRARPMLYIPVAVLAVGSWLAGQTGLLDGATSVTIGGGPSPVVVVAVLVGGVVVLVASALVSTRLYERREL